MIEVILDDRLGKKVRVKCNEDDTIGDLKKLAAAQLGTRPEKLRIQKWYTVYKVIQGICVESLLDDIPLLNFLFPSRSRTISH